MVWTGSTLGVALFAVSFYDCGCARAHLVVGHATTITTLSYAIRFWSKGTKRALFLRHEGFLCVYLWIFFLRFTFTFTPMQRGNRRMDQEH